MQYKHFSFYIIFTITTNQVINILFNSRYIQKIWRVVLRRTSFGTRSRFIDSNRSHFRSTSYIQNLRRYVKFVQLKYLCTDQNYYSQSQLYFQFPFNLGTFKEFGEYSLEEQEIMQRFLLAQEGETYSQTDYS